MQISEKQKRERIRLAERLQEELIYMLALMFYSYPDINLSMALEMKDRYMQALIDLGIASSVANSMADLELQAAKFSTDMVETTQRHKDEPYYFSEDRARLMSEDQSNFVYDIEDFAEAIEAGMRYKTWNTVGDNRVRESHAEVEGLTIPINEPFQLQGGLLNYPHDTSLGCDENEVIACRCTLSYGMDE